MSWLWAGLGTCITLLCLNSNNHLLITYKIKYEWSNSISNNPPTKELNDPLKEIIKIFFFWKHLGFGISLKWCANVWNRRDILRINSSKGTFSSGTFSRGTFSRGTFSSGTFSSGTFSRGTFSNFDFTKNYENNKLLATQSNVLNLDQSMNSVRSCINNPNLKYQRFNLSGCKDIGIWKSKFVAKTESLYLVWPLY